MRPTSEVKENRQDSPRETANNSTSGDNPGVRQKSANWAISLPLDTIRMVDSAEYDGFWGIKREFGN